MFLVLAALVLSTYSAAGEELSVSENDKTVLTLRISPGSLAFLAEHPSQLTALLQQHGVNCCSAQVRVSESVWRCCHGKFLIKSESPAVQEVLVAAFNGLKISGP